MKKLTIVTLVLGIGVLHLLRFQVQADQIPVAEPQSPTPGSVLVVNLDGASINGSETSLNGVLLTELVANNRSEAVIDMKQITSNLLEFQQQREQLKVVIAGKEMQAKERQQLIQGARQRAQKNGSDAESNDPQVTKLMAEFEQWRKEVSKDMLRMEGEIYLETYLKITSEVARYAKEAGIRVVRKIEPRLSSVQPTAVGRAYYRTNSSTTNGASSSSVQPVNLIAVEKNADGASPPTVLVPANNGATTPPNSGSGNGVFIVSAEMNEPTKKSPKTITVKYLAVGEASHQMTSGKNQNEDARDRVVIHTDKGTLTATEVTLQVPATQVAGSTLSVQDLSVENTASPDPYDLLNRMRQNEVIYADRENEFDITDAILQRMNAKFAKDQSGK